MNQFGLRSSDIESLIRTFSNFPEIEEAILFGSRAKGNFKSGSDVDIALRGDNITITIVNSLSFTLNEESVMPYKFDVLNYHTIQNKELIDHINRVGKSIYQKNPLK